jgi:hypothetical protein
MPTPCPHCGKALSITSAEEYVPVQLPEVRTPTRVDALAKKLKRKSTEVARLYEQAGYSVLADGPRYGHQGHRRRRVHPK